jgi:hypothetical protein
MTAKLRTDEDREQEARQLLFENLMEKYFGRAALLGLTKPGQTPESFYGFTGAEVEDCHHYRIGEGDGFWFRLKDGRVFCAWTGLPAPPQAEDYDAATLH